VEGFARSLPEAIALTKAHEAKAPGLWAIMMRFRNRNFRRGLVLVNSMLEAFGRNLPPAEPGKASDQSKPSSGRADGCAIFHKPSVGKSAGVFTLR
jgi:hypothetical protein